MEDVFQNLCDLHLHLGASVSPHFLWEIAHEQGISLPQKNYWQFLNYFKIKKTTSDKYLRSFDKNISPFVLTQKIQSSPYAVEKSIHHIVSFAYRNLLLKKIEIRFNPFLRNKDGFFDVDKIVLAATIGLHKAMIEYPIKAGIILETDRQFNQKYHQIIVEKAIKYKNMGIVGIDVSGPNPKDGFNLDSLVEPFSFAKKNGLKITFHTGEFTGTSEMWEVIKKISPHRIGHGIAAYKDKKLMEEIKRKNIVLEICPTSNIKTQVVKNWYEMKLIIQTFIANDVPFTINSDGPEFFFTNVKKEYQILIKKKIISIEQAKQIINFSYHQSFI